MSIGTDLWKDPRTVHYSSPMFLRSDELPISGNLLTAFERVGIIFICI